MTRLDAIDLRILATLQAKGRITQAALAEAVGLSPTPCRERLRRLERSGLIGGYHAEIDLEKLGAAATILVEVTLKQHRYEDFQRFETAIRNVDEVVECHATGGGSDYLLKIIAPDIDTYQRLIDRLLLAEIGIDRYFTNIVTRTVKASFQPPVAVFARSSRGHDRARHAAWRHPGIRAAAHAQQARSRSDRRNHDGGGRRRRDRSVLGHRRQGNRPRPAFQLGGAALRLRPEKPPRNHRILI